MRKFSLIAAAVAMTAGTLTADIQIGKGLTVGGFIDMAYTNVDTNTAGTSVKTSGFDIAVAEFQFGFDFGNGLSATVDLEGMPGTDGTAGAVEIEQARIDYAYGQSTLTLGKFTTFIGLESTEAPEMYQYSSSLTTDLAPTQHEGIAYAYNGGMWNVAAALVNGYNSDDSNIANGNKKELSYAIHLGVTPTDSLSFNLNYVLDNQETLAVSDDSNVLTVDASYTNHGWTLGAEYITIDNDNAAGTADTETDAFMIMANYMFTEQFGLTARYSQSEVETGATKDSDKDEMTFAASYAVTPNWSALVEYRTEEESVGKVDKDTIAIETILTF